MQVEIWSDVVCPWCYIGKRRFEAAIREYGEPVTVVWRSFQLDPHAPARSELSLVELLSRKYGMPQAQAQAMQERVTGLAAEVGLAYRLDQARPESTFDAHRLLQWARGEGRAGELKERLLAAYFTEGARVGDRETLARLAEEVGLDRAQAAAVLADPARGAEGVAHDQALARRLGISGVPFFVLAGRLGVSGAQEPAQLARALRQAAAG
jgi:predicted DsbA family dithiol-disulfide isomerase